MSKALVAVACIAVVAIAAMMFRQERRAAEEAEARRALAECAADLASLKPVRYETPESYALQKRVVACRMNGLISEAELNARLADLR